MPIRTATLMTMALRARIVPSMLNTSMDLAWIVKDWTLNIGSTLEVALADMTLTQCRFPTIENQGTLSKLWTWVALPFSWALKIATGTPMSP